MRFVLVDIQLNQPFFLFKMPLDGDKFFPTTIFLSPQHFHSSIFDIGSWQTLDSQEFRASRSVTRYEAGTAYTAYTADSYFGHRQQLFSDNNVKPHY